jgi:hypothetical protein
MPACNRVTPFGDIVAIPMRGSWLGNRGILHKGTDVVAFHRSNLWIVCELEYKDWRLAQWHPHHFTVLYFHDEAVSLAAGHRPCALCRRKAYNDYRAAWAAGLDTDRPWAKDVDRQLHAERIFRGTHRRRLHPMPWTSLPPGTFVALPGSEVGIVLPRTIVRWSYDGYGTAVKRPRSGEATVITPPSSVAALRAGYPVQIDPTAQAAVT